MCRSAGHKISCDYGTRGFITVFTTARQYKIFWASCMQSTPSHPISLRYILMLSSNLSLGFSKWFLLSRLFTKILYAFLRAMMEAARTSETLVNFYQTTRSYNPVDSHLRQAICITRRHSDIACDTHWAIILKAISLSFRCENTTFLICKLLYFFLRHRIAYHMFHAAGCFRLNPALNISTWTCVHRYLQANTGWMKPVFTYVPLTRVSLFCNQVISVAHAPVVNCYVFAKGFAFETLQKLASLLRRKSYPLIEIKMYLCLFSVRKWRWHNIRKFKQKCFCEATSDHWTVRAGTVSAVA
jgi:hypothetical protein